MFNFFQEQIIIFISSFFSALLLSLLYIQITKKIGLIDFPSRELHKIHSKPVPIAGGLAIFTSIIILSFGYKSKFMPFLNLYFFLAITLIFITGLLDDLINLSPRKKIQSQVVAALLLIIGGFQVTIFKSAIIDTIITLVWIVGITNAFNFLDGSDGLAIGIGLITSSFLVLFTYLSGQPEVQNPAIMLSGILLGVFFFNTRPAKLFLGDSGAQLIGLILALLALEYNPRGFEPLTSWISPILMMAVPIFDVTIVVISRYRRKIPVHQSGLDHTFHRLIKSGFTFTQTNLVIFCVTVVSNLVGLGILYLSPIFAFIIFSLALILGLSLLYFFEKDF